MPRLKVVSVKGRETYQLQFAPSINIATVLMYELSLQTLVSVASEEFAASRITAFFCSQPH